MVNIKKQYSNIAKLGKITTPYMGSTKDEPVHPGVDIANKNGTPIVSNTKGVVTESSSSPVDFGNSIVIKDAQGNEHRYSHLKDKFFGKGGRVNKGDHIGNMGATGNSYSPSGGDPSHLDYRVTDKQGKPVNPIKFFK